MTSRYVCVMAVCIVSVLCYNVCVCLLGYGLLFLLVVVVILSSRIRSKCHITPNITSNIPNTW